MSKAGPPLIETKSLCKRFGEGEGAIRCREYPVHHGYEFRCIDEPDHIREILR